MPRVGSPNRAFRMDDMGLWDRFGTATAETGTDRSAALRDFIRWYVREPGARLPARPARTDVTRSDSADHEAEPPHSAS